MSCERRELSTKVMFEKTKKACEPLRENLNAMSEILAAVLKFRNGDISAKDFVAMDGATRSSLAGAIAGNFAAHHPAECFTWLRALMNSQRSDT